MWHRQWRAGLIVSSLPAVGVSADVSRESAVQAYCDEPGIAFLATQCNLSNNQRGDVGFEISAHLGVQTFTFASGTSTLNIATAINAFANNTGAQAECVRDSCERAGVIIRSTLGGGDAFVSVQQLNGDNPFISNAPGERPAFFTYTDFGRDAVPGDVNCDWVVGIDDLLEVVRTWGACPVPPAPCTADLDHDLHVGIVDLLFVVQNWGAND